MLDDPSTTTRTPLQTQSHIYHISFVSLVIFRGDPRRPPPTTNKYIHIYVCMSTPNRWMQPDQHDASCHCSYSNSPGLGSRNPIRSLSFPTTCRNPCNVAHKSRQSRIPCFFQRVLITCMFQCQLPAAKCVPVVRQMSCMQNVRTTGCMRNLNVVNVPLKSSFKVANRLAGDA